jgi:septation ring formation regulator EzrA
MTIFRRSTGLGILLLSILGLLLCVAGITGVWMVKDRVEAFENAAFSAADEALAFVDAKIDRVKQVLDKSCQRVKGISKTAERLTDKKADVKKESEPLLQALDEVFQQLEVAESWLDSVRAAAQSVARVCESVTSSHYAASHGESTAVEMAPWLQEVSEKVAEVLATLQVLRREIIELRDTGGLAREVAARIVARLADLDGKLATIFARVEKFDTRVANAKASIGNLQRRIHGWIVVAVVAASVFLAWIGISQIDMMGHGWQRMLNRNASPVQAANR